ncbi:CCA tRNA nucleotidyltransferase [Halocynthiibacter sp. C4]|uniref:CCA tRNA nucleotidyltransferase n=1 Tax=Halocynthiibacter sp. C4 TaxID=2992758 RepID=UPI00237BCDBB|nr:CCA tRNA nucleotidyltransferase [Halocynthiibacter sp. C4]MDE0590976.1 CCA tRNA nucleotidyltransferase [Halocynthiibacter sp. C4]
MRLEGDWIDAPEVQRCCTAIEDAGFRAFLVGGCVRNAILNAPINDIDIATDATPDQILSLAKRANIRAVATGYDHGTITLVVGGAPVEVTTFRRDVETDGRRAVVAYSKDIHDDARRRDFTMNAIYATRSGEIVDPLNGLPDLLARRVRFIEDPDQRIQEDYLRILRFFRFFAWYGEQSEGLDSEGLAACAENLAGIETLAKERVGAEMLKLLAAPNPSQAIASMEQSGVLAQILIGATGRFLPLLIHNEQSVEVSADPMRRLAILGGEDVKNALRLSNAHSKTYDILRFELEHTTTPIALGYRYGADVGKSVLLLRAAQFEAPVCATDIQDVERGAHAEFPVKAADLMPALQGAELGNALKNLEQKWLESGLKLTRDQLLDGHS